MASNDNQQEKHNAVENLNEHLTREAGKIQENKKVILWIVGAIVVVLVFAGSYIFFFRNPRIEKSWEDYSKAYVEGMQAQSDSVLNLNLRKVADKYNGSDGGAMAAIQLGESLYAQKKYQEAVRYLEKADIDEPVLEASVDRLIGDCYVNLKQIDKAISAFDKAISCADGNPAIVPGIMMKKANIYESQKKYQSALDIYEQIKADYPEFSYGMGMDAYIARAKARLGK